MHHESFDDPANDAEILGPAPVNEHHKETPARIPPGLPPYLVGLYEVPLLTREEEGYYFRKMNYLKFKAEGLRKKLNLSRPTMKLMDEIEQLIEQSIEVKNFLIRSNLRLVVSIAKKHMKPHLNFFEMVSDGNMSLIKAIEKFDYSKGNKFSTYSTWAIMKNYARSIPQENKIQDRYRTGADEVLMLSRDGREDQFAEEIKHQQQKAAISEILSQLEPRDKDIIVRRFGLEKNTEPLTLEQVGEHLGVTKERIRQLESRALRKLKAILHKEKLDIPGIEL
jgi:RNA polymerase sigma factor (sigma-70 family)